MKKAFWPALIAGVAVLLIPGPANATVTHFGIKAGVSFASVFGPKIINRSFRSGFCGGAFVTYELSPYWALQPEALFVMKGSRHSESFGAYSLSETMSLEYLEIPILAKLSIPVSKSARVLILAGPSIAFGIRYRVNSVVGGKAEEENLDNVKGFDYGLVAGGGVEFPVKTGKVCLDIRYSVGLTSISTGPGYGVNNGAACILLGYAF